MEASGEVDLNQIIAKTWDKLLKGPQKEARDFLAQSQTKALDGSTLSAFFNKRLVSFLAHLRVPAGHKQILYCRG